MLSAHVLTTGRQAHTVPFGEGGQSCLKLIVTFGGRPSGGMFLHPVRYFITTGEGKLDDSKGKNKSYQLFKVLRKDRKLHKRYL